MASIRVQLDETQTQRPGIGYRVEVTLTVKARLVIPGLVDDFDDLPPGRRPRGPRTNVVFRTALAGSATSTSGADGVVRWPRRSVPQELAATR